MTGESDPPLPVIKLVRPPPDRMKERGARLIDLPKPARPPIGDSEVGELSTLVTRAITIRGAQKKDLVPHWLATDVMRIIDPNNHAPYLVRTGAMVLLRDLARQAMLAYSPPSDALNLIEEEEAAIVRRRAATDAAAALARRVPAICCLCGKEPAEGRGSLILQYSPPVRVCERCVVLTLVDEFARRRRKAEAEAAERAARRPPPKRKEARLVSPPGGRE
jgi:hypothetical protein